MSLSKWLNDILKKTKKFKWYDFSILKITVFSFALLLAKLWEPLLSLEWHWYGLVFGVTYLYLIWKIFKK